MKEKFLKALNEVTDKLLCMSQDEFNKKIIEHENSEYAKILRQTNFICSNESNIFEKNKEKIMNKSIKIIPFEGIENAFIVISARPNSENGNRIATTISFVYGTKEGGAEWEPNHGPITRLYPCSETDPEAEPHWFFPFYKGQGYWSQLAVDEYDLPGLFLNGDYEGIFSVLKQFAQ